MLRFAKGTQEYMLIDVNDMLNNLPPLGELSPTYDILTNDNEDVLMGASAGSIGYTAFCMIDTTNMPVKVYKLFLMFEAAPEAPRLGPIYFEVHT